MKLITLLLLQLTLLISSIMPGVLSNTNGLSPSLQPELQLSSLILAPKQDQSLQSESTPAPATKPTRPPRPTSTPPVIPPPTNPAKNNLMIWFGVFAVIVVSAGILLNRNRLT
jgi:hypothetical protein